MLDGGSGTDTVDYTDASAAVEVDLSTNRAKEQGVLTDTFNNIENILSGNHSDTLIGDGDVNRIEGGAGDDSITGNAGNDQLFGDDGADTFYEGAGSDTIDGGLGADTVDYSSLSGVELTVDLDDGSGSGSATFSGGSSDTDTLLNIENIVGTDNNDTITGSSEVNELDGSDGDDRLVGEAGNDTLRGGGGTDTADYSYQTNNVLINLADNTNNDDGHGDRDSLFDVENIVSGSGNDTLTGDSANNTLDGGR